MNEIRIAALSLSAPVGDVAGNLDKISAWTRKAARAGAAIVCFPELSVSGYTSKEEIRDLAEPIPGPSSDFLQDLAAAEDVTILAGIPEKDDKNRFYISHLVISPQGLTGIYRKTHLAPPEQDLFTPGEAVPIFNIQGLSFGIQLCYDAHFPELATRMALKGAEAIFIPHASPHGASDAKLASWMRHLPARAYDNSVFVVACNLCGDNELGLHFPGVGLILGPAGDVRGSFAGDQEQMLLADLRSRDLRDIRGHRMKYFLPNRRPEVYTL